MRNGDNVPARLLAEPSIATAFVTTTASARTGFSSPRLGSSHRAATSVERPFLPQRSLSALKMSRRAFDFHHDFSIFSSVDNVIAVIVDFLGHFVGAWKLARAPLNKRFRHLKIQNMAAQAETPGELMRYQSSSVRCFGSPQTA